MDTQNSELNPILEAAKSQSYQAAESAAITNSETTKATADLKKASEQRIAAEQIIATQASVAELQAQNNTLNFFENAGGLEIYNKLGKAYKVAAEDVLAAEAEIDRIKEESPADGVLSFIAQQFKLAIPEENLKSALSRTQAISKVTSDLSSQTESVARSVNFTKKVKNTDTIRAEQARLSALAMEETAKTSLESIKLNAEAMGRVLSATSQQLSIAMKGYELQNSEESRQMQRESHTKNMKLANIQLSRIDLEEDTVQLYTQLIQATQAKAGVPVEDPLIIRNGIEEIKKNTPTGIRYQKYVEMGLRNGDFGQSPADAIETISIVAPTGTEMTPPLQVLDKVITAGARLSSKPGYVPPKNKEQADEQFNTTAKLLANSWKSLIKSGDSDNPYHAPPFAALTEANAVKSSLLYRNVLAPLDLKEFSTKRLFQEASRGVSTKLISPEEATLGIETIIKAAISHNNEYWQFSKIGMPVQDSYITYAEPSETFFSFGSQKPTNILDPVEIKLLLIKYLSQSATSAKYIDPKFTKPNKFNLNAPLKALPASGVK